MNLKFQILKSNSRDFFHFRLMSDSDENLLSSEGYVSKAGCLNGINSVRKNSQNIVNYILRTSSYGKHYFILKARNGEIIGTSELFFSKQRRDIVIEQVSKYADKAKIQDLTNQ